MTLLILFAFLHPADGGVVDSSYRTLDACLAQAGRRNVPDKLHPLRPGDVWICAEIKAPT